MPLGILKIGKQNRVKPSYVYIWVQSNYAHLDKLWVKAFQVVTYILCDVLFFVDSRNKCHGQERPVRNVATGDSSVSAFWWVKTFYFWYKPFSFVKWIYCEVQ